MLRLWAQKYTYRRSTLLLASVTTTVNNSQVQGGPHHDSDAERCFRLASGHVMQKRRAEGMTNKTASDVNGTHRNSTVRLAVGQGHIQPCQPAAGSYCLGQHQQKAHQLSCIPENVPQGWWFTRKVWKPAFQYTHTPPAYQATNCSSPRSRLKY